MKLTRVKIFNYRNIDGITVCFNPDSNYIIGENNLGKTNFLSLLETVCNGNGFDEKDFTDTGKSIEIEIDIKLRNSEIGFFRDNFSPEDANMLKIRYSQKIDETYPNIVSVDTNETIQKKHIKKINFMKYETTLIPSKELRLDSQKGTGLFIKGIIAKFIANGVPKFLNDEQVYSLTKFINERLGKIRSFRDYSIKTIVASNPTEMLTNLLFLSDGDRKIETTGSGIQYIAMASINILCQIMQLYKSKSVLFDERVYHDDNGKKLLPLVLSIDEPEVHLHPYLQRSLIGFYKNILCNEDLEFIELLKDCFGIDGIDGQLIIVTHSTDALVGDYRNLIRFYKNNEKKTAVINGYDLRPVENIDSKERIKKEDEKHLIMRFPEVKEAFYAKCAILIEGETEYGCINAFAKKIGIMLDDFGICVINARGENSIKPIRHLFKLFAIPSIAIYDGDAKEGHNTSADEFYTNEKCFEIEIVKTLLNNNRSDLVKDIALELDSNAENTVMNIDFIRKPFEKMGVDVKNYKSKKLSEVKIDDKNDFLHMYSAWFMVKKGVLLGRIIGDLLPAELIPACYSDAIKKAKEIATNV